MVRFMERNRYRTPRVSPAKAVEAVAAYGGATVRFNLVVPRQLKRAVDDQATAQGLSGPELARRFIAEGLQRIDEEAVWERTARTAPLVRERDRQIVQRMDRIAESWEQARRARR